MLLSKQQEYILDVLDRLGCIRTKQLAILVRNKFAIPTAETTDRIVNASLQQLSHCHGTLRLEEDIVSLSGRGIELERLDAISIMLELGGDAVFDFAVDAPPILLRFVVDRPKLAAFAVAKNEPRQLPPRFYPAEKVIILLRREERPQPFPIQNTQIFAMKQYDGTYRFLSPKLK